MISSPSDWTLGGVGGVRARWMLRQIRFKMCVLSDLLCVSVNSLLLEGEFFLQLGDEGVSVLHLIFLHLQFFFKRTLQDRVGFLELECTHTHTELL